MSTEFIDDLVNGDTVEAEHVNQYAEPIQELESGAALFRVATNDSGAYQVDFTTSANPNGHTIDSLSQGQVIVFKASHNSPANATLKVLRNDAPGSETHPLFLGDAQAEADDILADQMVIVVFNATTTPRFDVVGISSGGGSVEELDDVVLTALTGGEVLQYNGTSFVNVALDTSDITGLDSALAGKAGIIHNHAADDITSGTLPLARGGTGGTTAVTARTSLDVPSNADLTTGLAGKAATSHTHTFSEVSGTVPVTQGGTGATTSAAARTALGTNDAANITAGTLPLARGGTNGTTAATARTSLDVPSNADLTTGLAGKAATTHTHTFSQVTGTVPVTQGGTGATTATAARTALGTNDAVNITAGTLPVARGGTGGTTAATARTSLDVPSNADLTTGLAGKANSSHSHAAADITSGQIVLARGGTGADLSATGGSGQVLKQSTIGGTVSVSALTPSDMPNGIDATKLGTGTVSNAELGYLDGLTSSVQTQIDGKANTAHSHAANDITSGQIVLARGGTGADLSSTGGSGQVLKQSTLGGTVSVSALVAGDMPDGISAAKIGTGTVSNDELGYLDGVTSSVQNQINGKANFAHDHAAGDVTSGQIAVARGGTGADLSATGGSGQVLKQSTLGGNISVSALAAGDMPNGIDPTKLNPGTVNSTQFGYLSGVTSAIQNQLNNKANSSHTHPATAIGPGTISDTEFGYLNNVTSPIQTQLNSLQSQVNGKVSGSGGSNYLTHWTGSSTVSYSSSNYISSVYDAPAYAYRTYIESGGFRASGGHFRSGNASTYLPNLRNQGYSTTLYWDPGSKEVGYLYSRAAHKKNVKTIEASMEDIMKWRPVEFEWKEAFGGQHDLGLISEEVDSVFPLAATYDQDWEYVDQKTGDYARDEEGGPRKKAGTLVPAGVKYERAWLPMLAGVQDFYKKFQELSKRVVSLEAQLKGAK